MRQFINAVVQLTEGKVHTVDPDDDNLPFRVVENPSMEQMRNMGLPLRGMIDDMGDFYVWDAYQATHYTVSNLLSTAIKVGVEITSKGVFGAFPREVEDNRNFLRAFGGMLPAFDDDDLDDDGFFR